MTRQAPRRWDVWRSLRRHRRRSILGVVVALVAAAAVCVAVLPGRANGQQCAHFAEDQLLDRLRTNFDRCIGEGAYPEALDAFAAGFEANEFDRHRPLALALFSNSTVLLSSLASVVATALFGEHPSPHAVQIVDFAALLPAEATVSTNHEIKQAVRSQLASPLRACPHRSLFVVKNVQALDDAALPVLDVFLDPLNGARAQFQAHTAGRESTVLDCTNSVFLFLFDVGGSAAPALLDGGRASHWREFLMQEWTRRDAAIEEFTPQAFVGRLTEGIALMVSEVDAPTQPVEAPECRFDSSYQQSGEAEESGEGVGMTLQLKLVWLFGLPLVVGVLVYTKKSTHATAAKQHHSGGSGHGRGRSRRGGRSKRRHRR